ncbi:MAG TPA: hypothetical protein DCG37_05880 [Lachnospiraceae bacterium]|nr:hypothetical protein [Lachnospiraceae bacterium]
MDLRNNVLNFLKKHEKAYYVANCVRYFKDNESRKLVLDINHDPTTIKYENFGDLNPDELIYLIYMDNFALGFFALFMAVMDGLYFAERFHMKPVVEYSDKCIYNEGHPINGGENAFEYYFEPVSDIPVKDARQSRNVALYKQCHRNVNGEITVLGNFIANSGQAEEYMKKRAELYAKYIRLKPEVQEYINRNLDDILGDKKCIGVHVRGTDFRNEYINHAKVVTLDQYLDAVAQAIKKHGFERIFLATDEESTVEKFRERFGSRVVCYNDIFRSTDGEPVHFSQASRTDHKYKMGLEVLRDMYTLAKCDGLICGYSNVSITARIVRLSTGTPYEYENIINNGFNQTGTTTYRDQKRRARRRKKKGLSR